MPATHDQTEDYLASLDESDRKKLEFRPWGNSDLVMNSAANENGIPSFEIGGSTKNEAAGFVSENMNFEGRYIALITSDIVKTQNSQLSLVFTVTDEANEYQLIFVHGPLSISGWKDTNYYERIDPHSLKVIDLKELLSSESNSFGVQKVTIVVQKMVSVSAEFKIEVSPLDFTVIQPTNMLKQRSVLHDLGAHKIVDLEFREISQNNLIIDNGWTISNIKKWGDNDSDLVSISFTARKLYSDSLLQSIPDLDIYGSILTFGAKDWLFVIAMLTPTLLYPNRMFRR
jgi:hypothetical protein